MAMKCWLICDYCDRSVENNLHFRWGISDFIRLASNAGWYIVKTGVAPSEVRCPDCNAKTSQERQTMLALKSEKAQ